MQKFKINIDLVCNTIANAKQRKAVVLYYLIKQKALSGCLSDFTLRSFAREVKISESTLRPHYQYLLATGAIYFKYKRVNNDAQHLYHVSQERFANMLDVAPGEKEIYIRCDEKNLETHFRVLVNKNILHQQRQEVHAKLIAATNESLNFDECEKLRKILLKKLCECWQNNTSCTMPINPDISISQKHTAMLFGCTSTSTGHYWQQKFKLLNLANVEARILQSSIYTNTTCLAPEPAEKIFAPTSQLFGKIFWSRKIRNKCLQLRNEVTFQN